jgi:hypothetical protein
MRVADPRRADVLAERRCEQIRGGREEEPKRCHASPRCGALVILPDLISNLRAELAPESLRE